MRNAIILAVMALCMAFAQGATVKVPLKDGWRFIKADDPAAGTNLTLQAMSGILDWAEKNGGGQGLTALPDFAWAKPAFDDSAWREVRVPHDWGVDKPFDSDLPYGDAFLDVTGVGWYRIKLKVKGGRLKVGGADVGCRQTNVAETEIDIPRNGKVFFECDGAMSYSMFFLNGKFLGGWPYGYTRWRIDLTKTFECGALGERALQCGGRGASALPDG